jgi:NitT/TauT family transport system permease protein
MNTASVPAKKSLDMPVSPASAQPAVANGTASLPFRVRVGAPLAVPGAAVVALLVHQLLARHEQPVEARSYSLFLAGTLGLGLLAAIVQMIWAPPRRWLAHMGPILGAGILFLCLWQVITTGLRLLPLPYFPSPSGVLQSLINDRVLLAESTWNSLKLLLTGYTVGVVVAVVTGVCIGWYPVARYWGMPLLKVIGPIPATAWVPLAMVVSPNGAWSAIGLVALAVWFPVTMLTISGIANTRASYLDVARTLGANQWYLIFRVAIPAALPNIFIGLFMGLGTSFLTLIVAETVGVKSGLGWYVSWAQGWAEYGKVFAALVIMSVFFSTIMSALFKVRDRVLVWQKGTIKW